MEEDEFANAQEALDYRISAHHEFLQGTIVLRMKNKAILKRLALTSPDSFYREIYRVE